MDSHLFFEISVDVNDPPYRVGHEAYLKRVLVVFGTPGPASGDHVLQLWFQEPATVVDLGKRLVTAGMRLAAQLGGPRPDGRASEQPVFSCEPELYPVAERKPGSAESRSDGAVGEE
jgi:hypothetical protein